MQKKFSLLITLTIISIVLRIYVVRVDIKNISYEYKKAEILGE